MAVAFPLKYFRIFPCLVSLQCLSTPTRLPKTSPWATNNLFRPRHGSTEDAFIFGPLSWAIMIKINLYLLIQSFLIKISPLRTTPHPQIGPQARKTNKWWTPEPNIPTNIIMLVFIWIIFLKNIYFNYYLYDKIKSIYIQINE